MNKKIILALAALSLTSIFCTFQSSGQASPTPDVNAMVNGTLTAMAVVTDTPTPTSTVAATGSISGNLSYPSDFLPPMRVVAFDATNTLNYSYVDTLQGQSDYTISELPAGVYHVVSYLMDSTTLVGGYTQMVPCGLQAGCEDHSLIDVTVVAGQTTTDINPGDWYADAGTFPPRPNP